MNSRTSCAIAVAALLAGCSPRGPNLDTRTFALKYLRGSDAVSIVVPYIYTDRPNAKGVFSVSDNAITVRETRTTSTRSPACWPSTTGPGRSSGSRST